MKKDTPIGIFDSGIGGISVLKQFVKYLPYERYVYLGDTARVPYGNRSSEIVKRYSRECVKFLLSKNVKLIVAACNTVSSVAMDVVNESAGSIPVIEMIKPAVSAALRSSVKRNIAIIGTRATIASGSYSKMIAELSPDEQIPTTGSACPLFVPLVEEGLSEHPATRALAEDYLEPVKACGADTLILACTHYPLLKPLLSDLLPGVSLIDSGEHAAVSAIRALASENALAPEQSSFLPVPEIEFYVTDTPPTFFEVAKSFLGFPVDNPKIVNFEDNSEA